VTQRGLEAIGGLLLWLWNTGQCEGALTWASQMLVAAQETFSAPSRPGLGELIALMARTTCICLSLAYFCSAE